MQLSLFYTENDKKENERKQYSYKKFILIANCFPHK